MLPTTDRRAGKRIVARAAVPVCGGCVREPQTLQVVVIEHVIRQSVLRAINQRVTRRPRQKQ